MTTNQLLENPDYQKFLRWELTSKDSVLVRRIYCDIAGDVPGGLFLSQLIYWFLLGRDRQPRVRVFKSDRFWVAKARHEWHAECRITSRQFDRTVRKLKRLGIVTTLLAKFNGTPTLHVSVNWGVLFDQIALYQSKNEVRESGKSNEPNGASSFNTNGQVHFDKLDKSLTESTPDSTPKITDKRLPLASLSDDNNGEKEAQQGAAPQANSPPPHESGRAVVYSVPNEFVPPTLQEVTVYIRGLGYTDAENKATEFYRKYESQNWLVQRAKMRSWQKMVDAWKRIWDASPKQAVNTRSSTETNRHQQLLAMVADSKKINKGS